MKTGIPIHDRVNLPGAAEHTFARPIRNRRPGGQAPAGVPASRIAVQQM